MKRDFFGEKVSVGEENTLQIILKALRSLRSLRVLSDFSTTNFLLHEPYICGEKYRSQ